MTTARCPVCASVSGSRPACLVFYFSIYADLTMSVCVVVSVSFGLCVCVSVWQCVSMCVFVCVCVSVCLSVCSYVYLVLSRGNFFEILRLGQMRLLNSKKHTIVVENEPINTSSL